MPNWCANTATFYHADKAKIDALESEIDKTENAKFFQHLVPGPEEWDYAWCCENWGCKWDANVSHFDRDDDNTITIVFDTAWAPPVVLYQTLHEQGWTISAYYYEPGIGFAGVWQDGFDDQYEINEMTADQLDDELPFDLNDMYNISGSRREWEEENAEEDEDNDEDVNDDLTIEQRIQSIEQSLSNINRHWPVIQQHLALQELRAEFDRLTAEEDSDSDSENVTENKSANSWPF